MWSNAPFRSKIVMGPKKRFFKICSKNIAFFKKISNKKSSAANLWKKKMVTFIFGVRRPVPLKNGHILRFSPFSRKTLPFWKVPLKKIFGKVFSIKKGYILFCRQTPGSPRKWLWPTKPVFSESRAFFENSTHNFDIKIVIFIFDVRRSLSLKIVIFPQKMVFRISSRNIAFFEKKKKKNSPARNI